MYNAVRGKDTTAGHMQLTGLARCDWLVRIEPSPQDFVNAWLGGHEADDITTQ